MSDQRTRENQVTIPIGAEPSEFRCEHEWELSVASAGWWPRKLVDHYEREAEGAMARALEAERDRDALLVIVEDCEECIPSVRVRLGLGTEWPDRSFAEIRSQIPTKADPERAEKGPRSGPVNSEKQGGEPESAE